MQVLLFSSVVLYFISCSSGEIDKYNLISKEEKINIEDFCKCTKPIQPIMERFLTYLSDTANLKNIVNDSTYLKSMTDSMFIMIKEMTPCTEKAITLFDRQNMSKEKEEQLLAYFKKYYPKCLPLVLDERRTDSLKIN